MMETYKIIRFYQNQGSEVLATGLDLETVQEHCRNPETSSRTCTSVGGKTRTKRFGPWFDGYTSECNDI
jgi:hypothetical protein